MRSNGAAAQQTQPQPPTRLAVTRVIGDTMKLVTVQNDRLTPVTVYLEAAGIDRRSGVVAAGDVATLQLPAWAVNGRSTVPTGIASIDSISVPLTAAERASTTITIDHPRNTPMIVFAEQGVRSVGGTDVPVHST